MKTRGRHGQDISVEDVRTAIKKLKILGTGFALIGSANKQIVQSVPGELNMDHTAILDLAQQVRFPFRVLSQIVDVEFYAQQLKQLTFT